MIKLKSKQGGLVQYVNMENVTYIKGSGTGSRLNFSFNKGDHLEVEEMPQEILEKIASLNSSNSPVRKVQN